MKWFERSLLALAVAFAASAVGHIAILISLLT